MKNISEISARVEKIIAEMGLSAHEFSKRLGYPRAQTVYDIINGKSNPSLDFFEKFINAGFSENFSIIWLISGTGDSNIPYGSTQQHISMVLEASNDYGNTANQSDPLLIKYLREKDFRIEELSKQIGRLEEKLEKKVHK